MSRVDLDRNRSSILQAFNEVSNPKNDTDWALFTYEGQTSVLKLAEKGDGGIDELVDELNSGKIMYAYCRVRDPNTDLPKFVLINWQGEGVPEIKKGGCANHISDVARVLKGAHVTINARTEDDVDSDDILKKVAKSSGSNYSFHKEKPKPGMNAPSGPVGSVYKKTRPHQEIKSDVRDQFWQTQQEDEKKRQNELAQKSQQEKRKIDEDTKQREAREASERDEKEKERMKKVYQMKIAEKKANEANNTDQQHRWETQQVEALKDDEERRKRADQLRKERATEAKSLVSQRGNNPRSLFEQKPTSQFDEPSRGPPPPRKLKHGFMDNEPTSQFDEPKKPIQLPREEPQSPVETQPVAPPTQRALPKLPTQPEPEPVPVPVRVPPKEPSPPVSSPTASHPPTRNILAEGLPKRQDSDEEEEQDWDAPTEEDFTMPTPVSPVTPQAPAKIPDETYDDVRVSQEPEEPQDLYDDVRAEPEEPQDLYDDVRAEPEEPEELYDDVRADPEPAQGQGQFTSQQGLVARALYDYQATEENEITFDPGDIITNIDRIDPGWWIGVAPDGAQGMFPSNYVDLLNE